jgi:hypothetical protein
MREPFGDPPMTLRPHEKLCSFASRTAQGIQEPLVNIPLPVGDIHHQGLRTRLLAVACQRITF